MAEKQSVQSHSQGASVSALNPNLGVTQQAFDAWKKVMDDQIARIGALYGEMAKLEGRGVEQMRTAIDEYSKIMKESLSYAMQYSSEWRRVTLEAARRTAELMTPKS